MRALALVLVFASTALANAPKGKPPLLPVHVTWDLDRDAAFAKLEAAKMSPRVEELRGYMPSQDGWPAHSSEPMLMWKVPNGNATARWEWSEAAETYQLQQVEIAVTVADPMRELASLRRRFGAPDQTTKTDTGETWLWVRGGIWLTGAAVTKPDPTQPRSASITFRRDDRPLP